MRIYDPSTDKTINKVEVHLTLQQAEDFAFRINDMANNPANKDNELLDDVISGDTDNNNFELNSIEIYKYNLNILGHLWAERDKLIILYDK